MNDLKRTILEMERCAHEWEWEAEKAYIQSDEEFYEKVAGLYRIAAACCWEKLERLEAGDGWRYPEKGELPSAGRSVISIVSGSPAKNITLNGSYQTATYYGEDSAGWVVDEWPWWENPTVHCWQPTPEAPEKVREIWAKIEDGEQE